MLRKFFRRRLSGWHHVISKNPIFDLGYNCKYALYSNGDIVCLLKVRIKLPKQPKYTFNQFLQETKQDK